jgi:hypothetical protein
MMHCTDVGVLLSRAAVCLRSLERVGPKAVCQTPLIFTTWRLGTRPDGGLGLFFKVKTSNN